MKIRKLSGFASLAAALASPSFAQEPAAPVLEASGQPAVQVFEPAYFARYSPNSALDMIQQVPGFSLQEGDAVRGFGGSAGNVLINGERPSTKSSLSGLLGRISSASVIRIELVTGASATLDMRGQTKVANVVVRETAAAAEPITFDATVRHTRDGELTGTAQASTVLHWFGGALNLSGVVSTLANNGPGGGTFVDGHRERYLANGRRTEYAEGYTAQGPFMRQLNFEFERDFSLFALNMNGAYGVTDNEGDRVWRSYTPDSNGAFAGFELNKVDNRQEAVSLSGDISRKLGALDLKLITYNRREWNDNSAIFSTYGANRAFQMAQTNAPESEGGESILRGQVNWRFNDHHSIEFAAETAYNFLDNITEFVRETPTTRTAFTVPGSDTKVEEFRQELQISDVWTPLPNLTIEPGFKFEMSRIEQDIAGQGATPSRHVEREFEYPKPSVTATWRIVEGRQLRLSYKREVAQLSFADFVSFADFIANQVTTGNDQLVPERTHAFNAEFEQRFWKGGVLTLLASYDKVEDVQDFVPIGAGDGPGNIGDGTRWSVGFRTTLPLDRLGVKGARIDANLNAGGAEVTDPVTGETREFSDEFKESWSLSFRHDFPEAKFSYGLRYSDGGPGTAYRFNETSRRSREDADISAWIETSAFFGVRIRAGVDDIYPAEFARTRLIYGPRVAGGPSDRRNGVLERIEQTHSNNGPQPFIRVSGKF